MMEKASQMGFSLTILPVFLTISLRSDGRLDALS